MVSKISVVSVVSIATELHRPKWVSLPLLNAILRDDVLISFITPPEFQTEPISLLFILTEHSIHSDSKGYIFLFFCLRVIDSAINGYLCIRMLALIGAN